MSRNNQPSHTRAGVKWEAGTQYPRGRRGTRFSTEAGGTTPYGGADVISRLCSFGCERCPEESPEGNAKRLKMRLSDFKIPKSPSIDKTIERQSLRAVANALRLWHVQMCWHRQYNRQLDIADDHFDIFAFFTCRCIPVNTRAGDVTCMEGHNRRVFE
ncbi:hypothetical protein TSMEX_004948 [Taenia solium]|eukprot:TsM_000972400 transcript=TsM_000972400 gene=TsM_000972400